MAQFEDLITFERASTGSRFAPDGRLEFVAADVPRMDHDPVTLEARGLLIEHGSANLIEHSEDFAGAGWSLIGAALVTGAGIAPDGAASMTLLREDSSNGAHYASYSVAVTDATDYTFSIFLRAAGRGFAQILVSTGFGAGAEKVCIDLTTGAVLSSGSVSAAATQIGTNGIWRLELRGTANADTTTAMRVLIGDTFATTYPVYQGDGVSGIEIWGAQIEAKPAVTSYIRATGAPAYREADIASVPAGNWFREDEGTFYVEFRSSDHEDNWISELKIVGVGGEDALGLRTFSTPGQPQQVRAFARIDGSFSAFFDLGAVAPGQIQRAAFAYDVDNFAGCLDGGAVQTDLSAAVPMGLEVLYLGNHSDLGSSCLDGHLLDFRYYPTRLSDADLQALTA